MEKQNWSYGTGGNGGLAQLGEHLPCKQGVDSSILFVSTRGKENVRLGEGRGDGVLARTE